MHTVALIYIYCETPPYGWQAMKGKEINDCGSNQIKILLLVSEPKTRLQQCEYGARQEKKHLKQECNVCNI